MTCSFPQKEVTIGQRANGCDWTNRTLVEARRGRDRNPELFAWIKANGCPEE